MKNFKKFLREYRMSFTLAEVVIVMAILSIMMVAFAPVVTKKTSSTNDAFKTFVRTAGNYGIYYGTKKDTKPVAIGTTYTRSSIWGSAYPKLFLVGTTDHLATADAKLTPQIAFITGNKGNNLEYAAGQLIVTGGLKDTLDISEGASYGGGGAVTHNMPSYWLTLPAFATDTNSEYGIPGDYDKNISVILGGNPSKQYKYDIGTKGMTIVGGNACPNVPEDGKAGLTCIGAGAGSNFNSSTVTLDSLGDNPIFIGKNAGAGYKYAMTSALLNNSKYKTNAVFIGDGTQDISIHSIFFGSKSLGNILCDYVNGTYTSDSLDRMICQDIRIGAYNNFTVIDDKADLAYSGDNIKLAYDTTATETLIPSDERLKNVGQPFTAGLEAINKINPVNFTYKRDENKFPHVGVIAQALAPVFPNAINTNKDGYFYIRTEDMFYAAINAIKELYQMYLAHDKKLQQLTERTAVLEQQNKELQELYTDLAKRVEKLDKKKAKDVNFTPMPVYDEAEDVKPENVEE